jgi:arginine/lysine/ornithine decarboxylase
MGERALDVRSALTGAKKLIPLEKAVGAVAAGAVGCYPPGTAVLFPGETITREAAEYLIDEAGKGAELFGSSDGMVTIVDNGVNN